MHFRKQITFKKSQTFPEVLEYCSKKFEAVYNLIGKHVGKISSDLITMQDSWPTDSSSVKDSIKGSRQRNEKEGEKRGSNVT
jgi:hypothetical protein